MGFDFFESANIKQHNGITMKNYINTFLLLIITICLIKIAFINTHYSNIQDNKIAFSSKSDIEMMNNQTSDVRVWNGYNNYTFQKIPLHVYCVNCQ